MSEVSISNVESQLVMGMRKRGTYAEIRPMIVRIHRYIEANGARTAGPPMFICHETPKNAVRVNLQHNADVEVVIPVSDRIAGNNEIACYELPGGSMAKNHPPGALRDVRRRLQKALRLDRGESQESGRADPGGLSQRPTESHAGRSF